MISEDVYKNLFYSSWFMMISFLFTLVASTFGTGPAPFIFITIAHIAFAFSSILFAIGLMRAGKEIQEIHLWKTTGILLLITGIVDTYQHLIYYALKNKWYDPSIMIVRIITVIIYLVLTISSLILLKILLDKAYSSKITKIRQQPYLIIGYILMIIPYIVVWVYDYKYGDLRVTDMLLYNLQFYPFILASFFIILGFFNLSTTIRSIKTEENEMEQNGISESSSLMEKES